MFRKLLLFGLVAAGVSVPMRAGDDFGARARASAEKSLRLMEKTGDRWKIPCLSCHHQGLAFWTYGEARKHGLTVNEASVRAMGARTAVIATDPEFILGMGADTMAFGYTLAGFKAQGIPSNLVSGIATLRGLRIQRPDGRIPSSDSRPPHSGSSFTATALTIKAAYDFLPDSTAAERDSRARRARAWLLENAPASTDDAAFRVLGLKWASAAKAEIKRAAADLLALQHTDGGWGQMPGMGSDAYSTGEALYALREAGVLSANDRQYRAGAEWLIETQAADGSWHVETRLYSPAPISPPYMETGFPYAKDQIISYAGTAWAVMALAAGLPEDKKPAKPLAIPEANAKGVEKWMEVAALGTAAELKAMLDAGLDPNTASAQDTTVLMYAAGDREKVEMLLARGANAAAQSKGGNTALTVAALSYGNAETVRLLADKGAPAEVPEVRPEAQPLFAAISGGDIATVKLLLDAGAKPESNPGLLMNAVQAGNAELVSLLAARGLDVAQLDERKMTPLMWAAIAHQPAVVEALLRAGADPAAVDTYGFTALQHTDDIRHSETNSARLIRQALESRAHAALATAGGQPQ